MAKSSFSAITTLPTTGQCLTVLPVSEFIPFQGNAFTSGATLTFEIGALTYSV